MYNYVHVQVYEHVHVQVHVGKSRSLLDEVHERIQALLPAIHGLGFRVLGLGHAQKQSGLRQRMPEGAAVLTEVLRQGSTDLSTRFLKCAHNCDVSAFKDVIVSNIHKDPGSRKNGTNCSNLHLPS